MMKMSENIDELSLIVRSFPVSFTEDEIRKFVQMFDPINIQIFIEHHAAIVEFSDKYHARHILSLLHQQRLEDTRIAVEFAPKNRNQRLKQFLNETHCTKCATTIAAVPQPFNGIGSTLKRLYATADGFDLEQPPPSYLYYEYPKINRDIIDSICIALEISPTFYIQVLHLMNRMNLEPPFVADDKSLTFDRLTLNDSIERITVSTQTDEMIWQNLIRNKRKFVESDESEMETSSTGADSDGRLPTMRPKRKKINKDEFIKHKQRNLLKMQRLQTEQVKSVVSEKVALHNLHEAFDFKGKISNSQIKIIVPKEISLKCTDRPSEAIEMKQITDVEREPMNMLTKIEIDENRIPADQLKTHPMFQNYNPGTISNCLYIKNIAKEVTEDDLRAIYNRYLEVNCNGAGNIRSIDIRLMTTGRMRGQCFVTFDGPYLDCNDDDGGDCVTKTNNKYAMVEKALRDTNGLIVKSKPLVVVYGKGKSNKS